MINSTDRIKSVSYESLLIESTKDDRYYLNLDEELADKSISIFNLEVYHG